MYEAKVIDGIAHYKSDRMWWVKEQMLWENRELVRRCEHGTI